MGGLEIFTAGRNRRLQRGSVEMCGCMLLPQKGEVSDSKKEKMTPGLPA